MGTNRRDARMDTRQDTATNAHDLVDELFRMADDLVRALDTGEGVGVRFEMRLVVDDGDAYAKVPAAVEAFTLDGKWYGSPGEVEAEETVDIRGA
jgi:hypothetical protein